jgi:phenylalanyl-tRNA synthetase beta chain
VRVVLSWLRRFCPTDLPADDLAAIITRQGVMVEQILRPWDGIDGVVVARVLEVSDHPDSDKLCVARVTDGSQEQIVCAGVKNFKEGDLVPWAKPGSRVPSLSEPLAPRKLRGVVSNGMLCSARELNVADVHTGILVIGEPGISVGQDFVEAFELNDAILDVEVEPNRPDFLSVFGVAREVSVATGVPLNDPDTSLKESAESAADAASVEIEAPGGCPRYVARVVRGMSTGRTPIAVQAWLTASGMRPISAVVDATNYAMLELGQPLHGFDMELVAGPGIVVRRAADGESIVTLDDQDRKLSSEDLLICDVEKPVAIAGVMGGATSEVSETTSTVLLESAYFTRTGILRTARRLGLHSEASHRFERGTDPENLERAVARCAKLIVDWAGGEALSGVAEAGSVPDRRWVSVRPSRAAALLGFDVSSEDVIETFGRLQMANRLEHDRVDVEVPGYRTDIEREVDLIEEVARLRGYDKVGSTIPAAGQSGGVPDSYAFRERAKDALVRAGLRETKLVSFASAADLELMADTGAVVVTNPLQADDGFLRTSLVPGLLRAVARNRDMGTKMVNLFEIGTTFTLGEDVEERIDIAFALAGPAGEGWNAEKRDLDATDAKGVLEAFLPELGVAEWELGKPGPTPFHPGRSAEVIVAGSSAGVIGEIHPRAAGSFGLEGRVSVAWLRLDALIAAADRGFQLKPVPRFPSVRRDLAFELPSDVPAGYVTAAIEEAGGELLGRCVLFDVFSGSPLPEGKKSLAFSVDLRAADRTLSGEEADLVVAVVVSEVERRFGGQLRSG